MNHICQSQEPANDECLKQTHIDKNISKFLEYDKFLANIKLDRYKVILTTFLSFHEKLRQIVGLNNSCLVSGSDKTLNFLLSCCRKNRKKLHF